MALSPWPNAGTAARTNAIKRLQQAVAGGTVGITNPIVGGQQSLTDAEYQQAVTDRANQIGEVAAGMVERYAGSAPQALKDEAVIRFAGYLSQADFGTVQSESLGPKSVEWSVNHADMFRRCGAAGLLSPWKARRAGAIK